jgi:hypothetical protein
MLVGSSAFATNIVYNGSFELWGAGWTGSYALIGAQNPADGEFWLQSANIWQDIPTTPGETYYVEVAGRRGYTTPTVSFDGVQVMMSAPPAVTPGLYWYRINGVTLPATGYLARIAIAAGALDDVRVIAQHEPIQVVAHPESHSVYEGGSVAFTVAAAGGPPIYYQWHFKGLPIEGATNASLLLTSVKASDAGAYSVRFSNLAGTIFSSNATLAVLAPPIAPLIVSHPTGDTVPVGYAFNLSVVAIGKDPLSYQWYHDGIAIPDGTNRVLAFPAIDGSHAGSYHVRVENPIGSSLSLATIVNVTTAMGGGWVLFNNFNSRAPIFDFDGVTRLSGSNFLAQLYVGASPTILRPVSIPRPFRTNTLAGYFVSDSFPIPDVPVGQTVYGHVRVWEAAAGISFEDARARGGRWGTSLIASVPSAIPPPAVPPYFPLNSFNLRAGSPLFNTGVIEVNRREPGQPIEWKLTGVSNSRYLIEGRTLPQNWIPLFIVTNTTGTVLFTDTNAAGTQVNFYRARMLD